MTQCNLVDGCKRFGRTYHFHLQSSNLSLRNASNQLPVYPMSTKNQSPHWCQPQIRFKPLRYAVCIV